MGQHSEGCKCYHRRLLSLLCSAFRAFGLHETDMNHDLFFQLGWLYLCIHPSVQVYQGTRWERRAPAPLWVDRIVFNLCQQQDDMWEGEEEDALLTSLWSCISLSSCWTEKWQKNLWLASFPAPETVTKNRLTQLKVSDIILAHLGHLWLRRMSENGAAVCSWKGLFFPPRGYCYAKGTTLPLNGWKERTIFSFCRYYK